MSRRFDDEDLAKTLPRSSSKLEDSLSDSLQATRILENSTRHRAMNLSPRELRDSGGNSRVRDLLMLDAMLNQDRERGHDRGAAGEVGLNDIFVKTEKSAASSVASSYLAEVLTTTRQQAKLAGKYHQQAISMLKQPYMHIEGSRYCLSLGVHSHAGPSAKQTLSKMNVDYRVAAEGFQDMEERLVQFAVELEKELALERRNISELQRSVKLEKLEYARLLDKFEEMKGIFQKQLSEERQRITAFKEDSHGDTERERDMWEKERERSRARDSERERELDRMGQRHSAETASLEREKDRQKRELLRESQEVDRLTQEVDRTVRMLNDERERGKRETLEIEKRHTEQLDLEKAERALAVKECEDRIGALGSAIKQEAEHTEGKMLMWEEQRRQMVTEKGALHATIVDMRREWEDTKSKLNTLAADNIMLREVMTDLRVNNTRLGSELRNSLTMPTNQRPEWNRFFYKEPPGNGSARSPSKRG